MILIVIMILIEKSTTWKRELNMDRQDGHGYGEEFREGRKRPRARIKN